MHTCRIVGSFCSLLAMVLPAVLTILLLVQHRKLSGRFSDPLQPASATHTGTHIHIHTHTYTHTHTHTHTHAHTHTHTHAHTHTLPN